MANLIYESYLTEASDAEIEAQEGLRVKNENECTDALALYVDAELSRAECEKIKASAEAMNCKIYPSYKLGCVLEFEFIKETKTIRTERFVIDYKNKRKSASIRIIHFTLLDMILGVFSTHCVPNFYLKVVYKKAQQ